MQTDSGVCVAFLGWNDSERLFMFSACDPVIALFDSAPKILSSLAQTDCVLIEPCFLRGETSRCSNLRGARGIL